MHTLDTAALSDAEGYVFLKKRQLGRKARHFVRVRGGVLSVHVSERACTSWDANLIGCEVRAVRRRSFAVALRSGLTLFITLASPRADVADWLAALHVGATRRLEDTYTIGEKVGEGAYAAVHKAIHRASGELVAVKTVVKRQFDTTMARELDREVLACTALRLPGIIHTRDVYNTQDKVHLIMDLMPGGTLKDRVQAAGGRVPEPVAAPIVLDTLTALARLHRLGVAHRDVKLENILCETETLPTTRTLLCDFGYVNFVDPVEETMRSLVGTPVYVAPEIASRASYGVAVDVWAVGVMAYRMISGSYPFDGGSDDEKTMELITTGRVDFSGSAWREVSPECISLLRALLNPNPRRRLSADASRHHAWFNHVLEQTPQSSQVKTFGDIPISPMSPPSTKAWGARTMPNSIGSSLHSAHLGVSFNDVNKEKVQRVDECGKRLLVKSQSPCATWGNNVYGSGFANRGTQTSKFKSGNTRAMLRLAVCVIVFQARLSKAARVSKPLVPRPRKNTAGPIPATAHPAQYVPLPNAGKDTSSREGDMDSVTPGPLSAANRTPSGEANNVDDQDSIFANRHSTPDRPTLVKLSSRFAAGRQALRRTRSVDHRAGRRTEGSHTTRTERYGPFTSRRNTRRISAAIALITPRRGTVPTN